MVEVLENGFLHQIKREGESREFPEAELLNIESAIKQVPDTAFENSELDDEVAIFDAVMVDGCLNTSMRARMKTIQSASYGGMSSSTA